MDEQRNENNAEAASVDRVVMRLFVVVVTSKEARAGVNGNPVMTPEGTKFIATKECDGWVEATSSRFDGKIPVYAKTFESIEAATEFAQRWGGHPWWCKPSGEYEVIEVKPRYRKVLDGYDAA